MTEPQDAPPQAQAHAHVRAALAAAQREIEAAPKDGTNSGQGYKFTSVESVIREARKRLLAHDLLLTIAEAERPTLTSEPRIDRDTGQVIGATSIALVRLELRLEHVTTETASGIHVSGEGADVGDKAISKAYSSAVKYGLRHLLLIPFGDDSEVDSPERSGRSSSSSAPGLATEGQARMMYAKAKAAGLSDEQRRAVLQYAAGVAAEDAVPRAKVDDVVAAIAKAQAQLARAAAPAAATETSPTEPADGPPLSAAVCSCGAGGVEDPACPIHGIPF